MLYCDAHSIQDPKRLINTQQDAKSVCPIFSYVLNESVPETIFVPTLSYFYH